jgi:hypothetical protein
MALSRNGTRFHDAAADRIAQSLFDKGHQGLSPLGSYLFGCREKIPVDLQ